MIQKVLIANRGEIAHRIIRACREMGIATVAVYSTPDRRAPHVLYADEAYHIGEAPAAESYLRSEILIEVARSAHCDAVHPGYGFLAENPKFARMVRDAGLLFIGPPAEAIATMGDKVAARKKVSTAGVPVVPGLEESTGDLAVIRQCAAEIGYPVLIKAVGGGGGKGMRIVQAEASLEKAVRTASSEAKSSFGDERIYLEKYLEEPHHIEFQILADDQGNAIHLFERECSVQRRYQKIIEESPSPFLDDSLRTVMGDAAVETARACDYTNAGTVEFLVDKHRNFYFLEMNTRLQVEHPVTEQVTGIDLVKAQIRLATGESLPWDQDDIRRRGHAIECRVYAEIPEQNFAPSVGTISDMHVPDGFGVRFDGGVYAGLEITPHYDPMIGKLICWGIDRKESLQRMGRALEEFSIAGVHTSLGFCSGILAFSKFTEGDYDTHILEDHFEEIVQQMRAGEQEYPPAGAAAVIYRHAKDNGARRFQRSSTSRWRQVGRDREMDI